MWHPSDLAVKPIILNRRIERLPDPSYDARSLPVEPMTSAELVAAPAEQVEAFLARLTTSVGGNTALTEKLNTLGYFETLCCDMEAANVLINSPFMVFLVRLLRTVKPPGLRVRIIAAMGLLIRHATVIEEELALSGIVAVLSDALRDKQEKVRRRAMATLGELLFYVATQNESGAPAGRQSGGGSAGAAGWQVPNSTVALVCAMLRKGEDETAQHYAVKAIENIASQGGEWAARFASADAVGNLVVIAGSTRLEHLRTTAGSCVVRLVRFVPALCAGAIERLGWRAVVRGLGEGTARGQLVAVGLLNLALAGPAGVVPSKLHTALTEEKGMVLGVVALMDHASEVLRGKALVAVLLLCRASKRWLPPLCNAKLVPAVERLAKDKDSYVQQGVEALLQTIAGLVPNMLDQISSDIHQLNSSTPRSRPSSAGVSTARPHLKSAMAALQVLYHLVCSQTFRGRIVEENVIVKLASYIARTEGTNFQGQEEYLTTVLHVVETLSQQAALLLEHRDKWVLTLLPSVATLCGRSSSGDTRFMCLKIFCDALGVLIDDLGSGPNGGGRSWAAGATATGGERIETLVRQHLLPLYPSLLGDEDPLPLYAQKLLVTLLDNKCVSVNDILRLNLLPRFFESLTGDASTLNVHSVRLCQLLALAPEVDTPTLSKLGVASCLGTLLISALDHSMEDFIEPALSLCYSLLDRNSRGAPPGAAIQDVGKLGPYVGAFLELAGSYEPSVAEVACECMQLLARAAPRTVAGPLLAEAPRLTHALETSANCHSPALLTKLQRGLLLALASACREQRAAIASGGALATKPASTSDLLALEKATIRLRKSSSAQVAEAANEAYLEIQRLPRR